jgi:poly(ADP-ribose) glycohydrolase ARH3
MYPQYKSNWRDLSTYMFPDGSLGNGGAMRVAPVGLAFHGDLKKAAAIAIESSRPTHSHSLAYQGAVIQCLAVAIATSMNEVSAADFLHPLRMSLRQFADLMQDTSKFDRALNEIEGGLARGASCPEMASLLGTGITAQEAVPMAIYCFLRHPDSYRDVIHQAVFIGGDTDTIACMAGAISGAFLGRNAIPDQWTAAVHEDRYSVSGLDDLADRLFATYVDRH